jgi:hypothetical protein
MPLPAAPTQKTNQSLKQANNDLLIKGLVCVMIGLVILLAPLAIQSPALLQVMGQSQWVGWFAVVLGTALAVLHVRRRVAARQ